MAAYDPPFRADDALVDLLIKQVTEGLSPAEERELEALDDAAMSAYARDLERATAAVSLAAPLHPQAMPASLHARLQQLSQAYVRELPPAVAVAPAPAARPARVRTGNGWYPWLVAAACLVLAVLGWVRAPAPSGTAALLPPPPSRAPAVAATAVYASERAAMLSQDDTVKFDLGPTQDPGGAGVSGDVVWDTHTQTGYLHFTGLKPNDPNRQVYQTWVFDATRDQRYPVDGGVFDIPSDATEAIIPIHAGVAVRTLAAIAITVEKPGGVVVSAREHIVALGKAG